MFTKPSFKIVCATDIVSINRAIIQDVSVIHDPLSTRLAGRITGIQRPPALKLRRAGPLRLSGLHIITKLRL